MSKEMNKNDVVDQKHEPSQPTTQPFIIGNINAASLFSSSIGDIENSMVIPPNVLGMPATVSSSNNQVIGILPVFIQGSNIPSDYKFIPAMTNGFDSSQRIHLSNNDFERNPKGTIDDNTNTYPSAQVVSCSSSVPSTKLASSDTLILSSSSSDLASADTLPLFISSSERNVNDPATSMLQSQSRQMSSSLQTAFSLVSGLSNRSVALESISTLSLFRPDQGQDRGANDPSLDVIAESENIPSSSIGCLQANVLKNFEMFTRRNQSPNKSKRLRDSASESDANQLKIDESIDEDTDTETTETFDQAGEKKQNSLTRDDTIILPNASQSQNKSSLAPSDTLIIPSQLVSSASSKLIMTSAGLPLETYSSSLLNTAMSVSDNNESGQPLNSSFPSIPTLMLTDSVVEGHVNPTLLCNLLSQTSDSQIPPVRCLTIEQLLSNANPNVVTSLQNSLSGSSLPLTLQSIPSSLSVKGTQTDWILENSAVYFKPVKMSETTEGIEEAAVVEDEMANVPFIVENTPSPESLNLASQDQAIFPTKIPTEDSPIVKQNNNTVTEVEETADNVLPFQCLTCKEGFSSKNEFLKHEKSHKKMLKCDLCTSTFTRMGNYTRHRKIHNLKPESQNLFTCTQCGREFLQRCDLKRHMLIHTNQQPYRCEKCGNGYIRRSDLVVHMRFHNKEKVFKCSMCDKSFFQSGDLSRHVRHIHKPNSQLTCGHCDRKYACEITLIRHMKVVHKDIILKTVVNQATKDPE